MAVNDLSFSQASTFLTALYQEATGQKPSIQITDTGSFTVVAQLTLKTGYDSVMGAISQVLSRTIFSIRPYNAKFEGILVDNERWGNITRKINFIDGNIEDDNREPLTDGQSVDPWVINKPKTVQTNFYGFNKYQRSITMFRDQLDVAFSGPEEFARFVSGVMQNMMDQLEQVKEAEARQCLINFITGKRVCDPDSCINVLQDYYDETGIVLTNATMFSDSYYVPFTKWLYAYINRLTQNLSERTLKYHKNITSKEIMRHTPPEYLKAYMSNNVMNAINSIALPSVYGADRLKMIDFEPVTFWQNVNDPYAVKATPTSLKSDGTLKTETSPIQIDNLMGVLFDRDALGITRKSEWSAASPFNPRGGYTNYYYHFSYASWNDFTENGIVLYAGTVTVPEP